VGTGTTILGGHLKNAHNIQIDTSSRPMEDKKQRTLVEFLFSLMLFFNILGFSI
jgi:hypothetical protein